MQTYTSIDDIWCEWGKAFSAIMEHIECKEPLPPKYQWDFKKGTVVTQHNAYCVSATFTTYHPTLEFVVELTVWATVESSNDKITVGDSGKRPVKDELTYLQNNN